MQDPALFVRVSTQHRHTSINAVAAERAGSKVRVLKQDALDKAGRRLPDKPRVEVEDTPPAAKRRATRKAASKLRDGSAAATPTPEPEADASGDTKE